MAESADLIKLYSQQILKLASQIGQSDPIENAQITVSRRSPLCGSNIKLSFSVADDIVTDYSQDVKACALGQAAASVIGNAVVGQTEASLRKGRDQLFAMLTQDGPAPDAPFDGLHVLISARDFKNRHASIMLCFEALLQGFAELKKNRA